jgi:D-alanyl-D-alanine carboxypeptidase
VPFTTAGGKHSLAANVNGDRAGDLAKIVEAEFCGGWPSGGREAGAG